MSLLRAFSALLLALVLGTSTAFAQDASPTPAFGDDTGSGGASPSPGAVAPTDGASPSPGLPGRGTVTDEIEVVAVEMAFLGVPANVPVGTAFRLRNDGQEVHEFVVVRRNEGTEQTVDELLGMSDEEAFTFVTFVGVLFAAPGQTSPDTLVIDEPGRYIAVCFVPQGTTELPPEFERGDPATEPDASPPTGPGASPDPTAGIETGTSPSPSAGEGTPHVFLGQYVEFTVGDELGPDGGLGAAPESPDAGLSPIVSPDAGASSPSPQASPDA
jgi:hypothetical protein